MSSREEIKTNFNYNLSRVENLVAVFKRHAPGVQGRRNVGDLDILRAAVVLLHASFEDLLRNIAYSRLPLADSVVLTKIGFPSSNRGDRQREKITVHFLFASPGVTNRGSDRRYSALMRSKS